MGRKKKDLIEEEVESMSDAVIEEEIEETLEVAEPEAVPATVEEPKKIVRIFMTESVGIYNARMRYGVTEDALAELPEKSYKIIG